MNPVRLQNKSIIWIIAICLLIILFIFSIITIAATSGTNDSCNIYKIILIIEPIWIFIYYRLYSRLLIKITDTLTCKCAEHGIGYAVFHYAIWSTIGHPWICFLPFLYLNIEEMIDIFSDSKCTINSSLSPTQINIWNICFVITTILLLLIYIPSGIVVSYKNHKDVTFQLHWKEQNTNDRNKAISNAIDQQTVTYSGQNIENNNENNNQNQNNINTINDDAINASEMEYGDVNINEFNSNNNNKESDGDIPDQLALNRQDTEEQLRRAIQASMITAQVEEEKRHGEEVENNNPMPPITRQHSISMSGFWAKGQAITNAYLGNLFNENHYECVVCYEDYKVGDVLAKLKCGHQMHKKCCKQWLLHNPTCPFCRINVLRDGIDL